MTHFKTINLSEIGDRAVIVHGMNALWNLQIALELATLLGEYKYTEKTLGFELLKELLKYNILPNTKSIIFHSYGGHLEAEAWYSYIVDGFMAEDITGHQFHVNPKFIFTAITHQASLGASFDQRFFLVNSDRITIDQSNAIFVNDHQ